MEEIIRVRRNVLRYLDAHSIDYQGIGWPKLDQDGRCYHVTVRVVYEQKEIPRTFDADFTVNRKRGTVNGKDFRRQMKKYKKHL